MALTTSDELQKQLTVIFGFSGQLNIEVGEIVGIGKLSDHETKKLIQDLLRFLNNYNSMLKDYAGCSLYSIEFELENLDKRNQVNLLPKSMLFIPGAYKDCNTLLFLLSPEMSLLDHSKAKDSVDKLGQKYFEVEEALDRPEMKKEQKFIVLSNFAHRFALKLQGDVIKGKWNRKMIGIKSGMKEEHYLTINIQKEIKWKNKEIIPKKTRFSVSKLKMYDDEKFEFMKHWLNQSTSFVIAQNTFKLTANLLQIANTGTINDNQKQLLIIFLNSFLDYANLSKNLITFDQFKEEIEHYFQNFDAFLGEFKRKSEKFIKSGIIKPLSEMNKLYLKEFPFEKAQSLGENCVYNLARITHHHLTSTKYRFHSTDKVRASELNIPVLYIEQSAQLVLNKIKNAVPFYIQQILFESFFRDLLESLRMEFNLINKKPIRALSVKYLEKIEKYLQNHLEFSYSQIITTNQHETFLKFKKIVQQSIEPFINTVTIEIKDLIDFCEIILSENPEMFPYIEHLKRFQTEIQFLWGFILRASTFQRFLKEYPKEEIFDPENFSIQFIKFLEKKRLGGLQLKWKTHIFQWINTFRYENQPKYLKDQEQKIKWSKTRIITSFIDFIGENVKNETTIRGFLKPLKAYLDSIAMLNIKNRFVLEIYQAYKLSIEIMEQFPDYLRQIFTKTLERCNEKLIPQSISAYIGPVPMVDKILSEEIEVNTKLITKKRNFFKFIINSEMEYFSKLIAKPKRIILQSLDRKSFHNKILQHRIEFDALGENYIKMSVFSNFRDVNPRY